jgi:NAD(P)H dehydrogenase (quinone)
VSGQQACAARDDERVRLLVAFYSRGGSVEALAEAIVAGAERQGAEVRLRRVRELVSAEVMDLAPGWRESAARMNAAYPAPSLDDIRWADGIAIGAPTRFGGAASEMRGFLEGLGALWVSGDLRGKPAGVFTSSSSPHGGLETTALGLYPTLAHLGMIIVPTGYGHPALFRAGTPYGSASVSRGAAQAPPTEDDLAIAAYQGDLLAQAARALRPMRRDMAAARAAAEAGAGGGG